MEHAEKLELKNNGVAVVLGDGMTLIHSEVMRDCSWCKLVFERTTAKCVPNTTISKEVVLPSEPFFEIKCTDIRSALSLLSSIKRMVRIAKKYMKEVP
jgi:hypothetical protein